MITDFSVIADFIFTEWKALVLAYIPVVISALDPDPGLERQIWADLAFIMRYLMLPEEEISRLSEEYVKDLADEFQNSVAAAYGNYALVK